MDLQRPSGQPAPALDASGTEKSRHWYYPFGEEFQPPANPVKYRYNAKERDAETGMQDYGARYYDTLMGRFTAVDPARESGRVRNPQTWNRYVYTINNPTSLIDPDGRQQVIPTPEGPVPAPIPVAPRSSPALPANPDDRLDQGYVEVTHPKAGAAGEEPFTTPRLALHLSSTRPRRGVRDGTGEDHYHRPNPNSTGKGDEYLDSTDKPVPRRSGPSHLKPDPTAPRFPQLGGQT